MSKMISRRTVLKMAAMSGLLVNRVVHALDYNSDGVDIGLSLWTVRKQLAEDPVAILKLVSELGYSTVETTLDQLADLKPMLDDVGLAIGGLIVPVELITGKDASMGTFELAIEKAMEENIDYLTINSPREYCALASPMTPGHTPAEYLAFYHGFAADISRAGNLSNSANITLAFHIHSCEFQLLNNTTPIAILTNEVDPELLKFQIDTFSINMVGKDPAGFIASNRDRCTSLHLKDRNSSVKDSFDTGDVIRNYPNASLPVGDGVINFGDVLRVALESGIRKLYVEQDHLTGDPSVSLGKSFAEVQRLIAI